MQVLSDSLTRIAFKKAFKETKNCGSTSGVAFRTAVIWREIGYSEIEKGGRYEKKETHYQKR